MDSISLGLISLSLNAIESHRNCSKNALNFRLPRSKENYYKSTKYNSHRIHGPSKVADHKNEPCMDP